MENEIKRPFTVVVEGNIGSGKTTFLNHFQHNENVSILTEPIDLWQNCSGSNLLVTYNHTHTLLFFVFT
jgi:deoxynucleoside kinase